MPVTLADYRLAILDEGIEEWVPLAAAMVRAAGYFPELSEPDRAELCGQIYTELLTGSLIAIASEPPAGRPARPLSPTEARAAIAADDWRHQPGDIGIGYVTTRAGAAQVEETPACWVCDGFVHRIASSSIDFEGDVAAGTVPVCGDHARQEDWPEGAEGWVSETIMAMIDDFRPASRLN